MKAKCNNSLGLIHGWGMNSRLFDPLLEKLPGYRVIALDLPGYGGNQWRQQEAFDAQVDRLADNLQVDTLLGWSLGGLYAIRIAQRYPERVKRLLLVACNPCFVQREDWSCGVEAGVFEAFAKALDDNPQATIQRFIRLQMFGAAQSRSLVRQAQGLLKDAPPPHPQALRFGLDLLLRHDAREALKDIRQPVLCLLGEQDSLVPPRVAENLRRLSPRIRVECVAHSAHAPFLSDSHLIAGLIREFTESPPPG